MIGWLKWIFTEKSGVYSAGNWRIGSTLEVVWDTNNNIFSIYWPTSNILYLMSYNNKIYIFFACDFLVLFCYVGKEISFFCYLSFKNDCNRVFCRLMVSVMNCGVCCVIRVWFVVSRQWAWPFETEGAGLKERWGTSANDVLGDSTNGILFG